MSEARQPHEDWATMRQLGSNDTPELAFARTVILGLETERDRYREALDEIANAVYEGTGLTSDEMRFVALSALNGGTHDE